MAHMHSLTSEHLHVVRGDITTLHVDAIVNAANSGLLGGGGVDGAIHRAGGPEVLAACRALRRDRLPHGLPPGQAVATTAGRLPCRWIIHTVGPIWSGDPHDAEVLASCYRSSLAVADEIAARTVAFPTISAGVYGYPMAEATRIGVETVLATPTDVTDVTLVAFGEDAERGYRQALNAG